MTSQSSSGKMSNEDLNVLRKHVTDFCRERGYTLSTAAENILTDIVKLKESTGDFYCPCQTHRNSDTVCVCTPVRNGLVEIMGACFCGLILKGKGE